MSKIGMPEDTEYGEEPLFCVLFYLSKKGVFFMNRSENHKKSNGYSGNRSQKQRHHSKKMSRHVIENLMGIHDPTYRRV